MAADADACVVNTREAAAENETLWPRLSEPADLAAVELVALADRGLPVSTYAAVERAAQLWPEQPATTVLPNAELFHRGRTRTFAQLLADVRRVANALTDMGVSRGAAVGLLSPNNEELLTATLAAQAVGVAAPVNSALSVSHLGGILRRAGINVLVAAGPEIDGGLWANGRLLASQLGLTALLALRPTGAAGTAPPLEPLDGITVEYLSTTAEAQPAGSLLSSPPNASDLAAFFHTGGTTGIPKLAAHTHANQISDAWMLAASSDLDQHATVFAGLPLFHVNALIVTVLAPLLRGRHTVWSGPLGFREPAFYELFWKIIEEYSIATMSAVPTVYAALAQQPVNADISSLRFAAVGASPLPATVREAFESRTGVELAEGYGLTEATCASARQLPGRQRPGSVGQRLPYQHIKAIRTDGSAAAPGEPGQLLISGPTVFAGYVTGRQTPHETGRQPGLERGRETGHETAQDAHEPVLDDLGSIDTGSGVGWLATGDLGWVDDDGFVYLTGRVKDVIIRGGHNIDPAVVEDAVLSHPAVAAASAVGRPDRHAGEVPIVYVTVHAGDTSTDNELLAWASEHCEERGAIPKEVIIVEALPFTDVGKPYKVGLRQDAMRREATAALRRAGLGDAHVRCVTFNARTTILVSGTDDHAAISQALSGYTFPWQLDSADT